ncbi:glycerophosphodiester phosphodiesterase [Pelosinus sp. sgz500959]|uniref:glycerophosphodiester phosphodiesterase n=1 Tax=Pelosinus sp. sgz500959 TaxID=3242472 RepID=UPI00366CBBAD
MPDASAKATVSGFDLQAHRGGRDARPENTLPAFAYAMNLGVSTLEMDMQLTKDGYLVISHNPKLETHLAKDPHGNYVVDGEQPDMRAMTLAEIKAYDMGTMNPAAGSYYEGHGLTQLSVPGTRVPTLNEVFELAIAYGNKDVKFNIETKSYVDPVDPLNPSPKFFAQKVMEVVKKYHMQNRVTIQSFDWKTLQEVRKIDENITLVALTCEQASWGPDGLYRQVGVPGKSPWMGGLDIDDFKGDYVKAAKAINADVVSPYWEEVTPELVTEAHKLNMKIVPWTVNNENAMESLLNMGVDGMISDKPEVLRNFLIKKGIKVPAPTPGMLYYTGTKMVSGTTKTLANGGDSAY